MMSTRQLAPWQAQYPGRVAGSVYAVPAGHRTAAARELSLAGFDVHVDVMAEGEGLPPGVSIDELRSISTVVDRRRLDVHLIGSASFVDAVLPEVLAARPGKVFLPWHAFTDGRASAVRAADGAAWIAVWSEWDGISSPGWPATPDGALVMLIEPGTSGRSQLGRLGVVTACADELPVIVDGGVTGSIAPLCISAGAQSLVVGRALLASAEGDVQ